jgi:hypothetical protein
MSNIKKVLITGPPQSGKTRKLAQFITENVKTHSVVVVIRNLTTDKGQLESKLERLINVKIHTDVIKFEKQDTNSVLIIQWNKTQLTKASKIITRQFYLFTDEADDIGYKNPGIVSDLYETFKARAIGIYEVTATPWDIFYGNNDLNVENVITVKPTDNFRGIDTYKFNSYSVQTKDDLEDVIHDYYLSKINDHFTNQPSIILHKNGNRQATHNNFILWIANNALFKSVYTVIVEDGRGFQLFCPHLETDGVITINGIDYKENNIVSNYYDNISNKNLDIQEFLQWIKNSDISGLSHIIIKTGNQAGRSRSYVSADGKWHLTHQFLYNSRDIPIPDLIQSLRLSHSLGGNNILELTAPVKTIKDIEKGNNAIIKALKVIKESKDSDTCKEKLSEIKWNIEEIPNAKLCKSPLHKDINKSMLRHTKSSILKGKYTILDLTKLNNTKLRRGLEKIYCVLKKILDKKTGGSVITLPVKIINEKILHKWYLKESPGTSINKLNDRVHGAVWTPVRNSDFFDHSNNIVPNFINYYTSNQGVVTIAYKTSKSFL